jgi:hypothetical protein
MHSGAAKKEPRTERGLCLVTGFLVLAVFFGVKLQARESSESPRLNAFCRVAPSVRFKLRAMLTAPVFFRASFFNVRT